MRHDDPFQKRFVPSPRADRPFDRPPFSAMLVELKLAPGLRLVLSSVAGRTGRKRGPGHAEGEPCPVVPNRPLNLSGGAAAALEFDD